MKIAVVVSDDAAKDSASVRLRYLRLQPALKAQGHSLELVPLEAFRRGWTRGKPAEAYILSKIYDARSVALAHLIRQSGRLVAFDAVDDYFSPGHPHPELGRLRHWFASLCPALDLLICGTEAMAARLADLAGDLPISVVPDVAPAGDAAAMAGTLTLMSDYARRRKRIDIAWFGMGDNPIFNVGLTDLAAFGDVLAAPRAQGYEVRLKVLTNPRALDVAGLERLARLPVRVDAAPWSEAAEAALLKKSLVAVLPVGETPFSTIKSLNRALTALSRGVQVLSLGHPIYAPLEAFLYRDFSTLLADLETDTLRLRPDRLAAFEAHVETLAGPEGAAARLVDAFAQTPKPEAGTGPICVLHGIGSGVPIHKQAQRMGVLSVATRLTAAGQLHYDVAYDPAAAGGLTVELSERAAEALRPGLTQKMTPVTGSGAPGKRYRLALPDATPAGSRIGALANRLQPPSSAGLRLVDLARRAPALAEARAVMGQLFEAPKLVVSDLAERG